MTRGRVKWFSDQKGFGFIQQVEGFKTLKEGQEIEFEVETSDKGLRASNVLSVE